MHVSKTPFCQGKNGRKCGPADICALLTLSFVIISRHD